MLAPPVNMSLDNFIDELLFYEIANVDGAIQDFANRFDESDTDESSDEEEFPEVRRDRTI